MAMMTKESDFKAEGAKEESSATPEMWEWENGAKETPGSAGATGRNFDVFFNIQGSEAQSLSCL